jgi:hypothetical protein
MNPHQPQTLVSAVLLCYIQAVLTLLFGYLGYPGLFVIVGLAAGGFGIANEKKWGYLLAVVAAVVQVGLSLAYGNVADVQFLIGFAFDVLLVALLLHPMSRDYQRIWFK